MELLVQNEYSMLFRLIASLILNGFVIVPKGVNDIDYNLDAISTCNSSLMSRERDSLTESKSISS